LVHVARVAVDVFGQAGIAVSNPGIFRCFPDWWPALTGRCQLGRRALHLRPFLQRGVAKGITDVTGPLRFDIGAARIDFTVPG
jgi:hypothetical protein